MWKNVAEKHMDALTRKRLNKISSIFSKRLAEKKARKQVFHKNLLKTKAKIRKFKLTPNLHYGLPGVHVV